MTRANSLTRACLTLLTARGALAWRSNSVGVYDPVKKVYRRNPAQRKGVPDILAVFRGVCKGVPDILAVFRGVCIGVEIKVGKDKLSPDQIAFANDLTRAGGIYVEVRDAVDELVIVLTRVENEVHFMRTWHD